ncbi:MAG: cysteine desulfurase NifS [Calditrichaeota bacterium]|nr:cysteine desulfurase NifS [Calditrichota bacterium]
MHAAQKRQVYLDYSATTPVDQRVLDAMLPYFRETFGNPSSAHRYGKAAQQAVEAARQTLARLLHCRESEIVFTSGGTESDNLAIRGVAHASRDKGNHIITSQVEHAAVLKTCRLLEKEGFAVTYLPVDSHGRVDPDLVAGAIRKETILISIIHGNNEVGTINPIQEIGAIARQHGIPFHTDAVQSFGKVPLNLEEMPIDLLSLSSHKIYGPKGVGALFIRRGTPIQPILTGGGHEMGKRAGTHNVPGIVGLARAAEIMITEMASERREIGALRDYFWEQLRKRIDNVVLNGHPENRLYHNLNVSFPGCDGEALLMALDMFGIAVSTGSACQSGSVEPSHVLKAMGLENDRGTSALRFTLGRYTTREDIDYTLEVLEQVVPQQRQAQRKRP